MSTSAVPRDHASRMLRYLGAAALLGVGADHLDQYALEHYAAIPTIGTLFVINFAAATVVAVCLAAAPAWLRPAARDALVLCGIAIAAGSLLALFLSERIRLFGFMETGFRAGIVLSIALDALTILLLAARLALPHPEGPTLLDRPWTPGSSHAGSAKWRKRS